MNNDGGEKEGRTTYIVVSSVWLGVTAVDNYGSQRETAAQFG